MPYGLPGALRLDAAVHARDWQTGRTLIVQQDAILAPCFPAADQDGWDGDWCCKIAATGQLVAIPGEKLPVAKR